MRGICGSRITRMRVSGTAHCLDPDGPSRFPATMTLPAARIWLRASRTDQPAAPSGSVPVFFPGPCSIASVRLSRAASASCSSKAYERARMRSLPPCPLTLDPLCALPPSPSPSRRRRPGLFQGTRKNKEKKNNLLKLSCGRTIQGLSDGRRRGAAWPAVFSSDPSRLVPPPCAGAFSKAWPAV